jgi:hypothetical protein
VMGALMIKRPAAGYLPPGYTPPLNAQVIPLYPLHSYFLVQPSFYLRKSFKLSLKQFCGTKSGSISQRHGSADPDPDPPQNVMDPQHWCKYR